MRRRASAGTVIGTGRNMLALEGALLSQRGALEVGLRIGALGNWGSGAGTLLSARSERRVASAGAAVVWVPGSLTRLSVAYDITATDRLRNVKEHALMLRVQQAF
jgi:hypothetical protein